MKVSITDIMIGSRLRAVDQDYVAALSTSISERGLLQPIQVREQTVDGDVTYILTAGAHRLTACQLLGWTEISVTIVEADEITAKLAEIDENLFRRELSPFDRAIFLSERKALYETLHPTTRKGGDRKSNAAKNQNETVSFSSDAADKTGLGKRAIERAVRIATALDKDVRSRIAGTWLTGKEGELYALTKHGPARQMQIVEMLLDEQSPAKSVKAAVQAIEGHAKDVPSPEEEQLTALMNAWRRAGTGTRRDFVAFLRQSGALGSEFNE